MIDLVEIPLVKAFGWSLRDIDETDIDTLLPFVFRFAEVNGTGTTAKPKEARRAYADEVTWL